ncbi:MAG: hypothetical protein WBP72_13320 [Rhodocyclaceae bacterium]
MDTATKQRLDELMSWYVTGQIDEQDRAWVEQLIREDAQAHAQWQWHQRLQENLHAQVDALPAEVGLDRLMARVRADQASRSWLSRLVETWGRFASRPALAIATALVLAQAGVIGVLLTRDQPVADFGQTRELPASGPVVMEPVLRVSFKPEATERDMRLLLVQISGRVIDGPTQLGDYLVWVPEEQIDAARRQLEGSAIVDGVAVFNRPAAGQ